MARTEEGLPIITRKSIDAYTSQASNGNQINYKENWDELNSENPMLAKYIEHMSFVGFPPPNPAAMLIFGSQVYFLLKRQAQIDELER